MRKASPLAPAQKCNGARSAWCSQRRKSRDANRSDDRNQSASPMSLQQAMRTLWGIRLRYEIDSRNSDARLRSVIVALSCADMVCINAAIEALEKALVAGAAEAVGPRCFRSRKDGE